MNKSFNLLFSVKRSKTNTECFAPVYLCITIDGVHIEISSKRYVNPDKWNINGQKLTHNNEDKKVSMLTSKL
ncbi:integrase-like protein [Mucilaginibacter oryzae]|uniref:Integrase-like protein n=1 Tax=Mucilaginibacter oryzae TaxID=468058 RepID=A0A316HGW5_9SPHI|nr:Arm DNA-binding domain-containing protein [Mucilaginibacter oryzae]PWK79240.1 integrase-like protein [Mucilaginibacter oryzae]